MLRLPVLFTLPILETPANSSEMSYKYESVQSTDDGNSVSQREDDRSKEKLGELAATSIAGNDVLSSCFYTVGIAVLSAGVWAPVCMLLVVVMLYFFKTIYTDVGSAIPYNGGAYNVMLATTSRGFALFAASLTLVSYIATGVVSSLSACHYLFNIWDFGSVLLGSIILLCLFAVLSVIGISESAMAATVIFVTHTLTLSVLVAFAIGHLISTGLSVLYDNASSPLQPPVLEALFYGFSAATLGITGYETSANYIEEQKPGVFPKTLKNMFIVSLLFNPLLSFLAVSIVPLSSVKAHEEITLSKVAEISAGRWLEIWVSIDAFLVLSGSVITSYVGVGGLVKRLSMDECMPSFFLKQNEWRQTHHWIIIGFLLVCTSLVLLASGHVSDLAGVYSLAFVAVMGMFAVGDLMLGLESEKEYSKRIRAHMPEIIAALLMVSISFLVTIVRGPRYFLLFSIYMGVVGLLILIRILFVDNLGPPQLPASEQRDADVPKRQDV